MKKSYFKIIWREFKGSFGRFAAIFGIVALGVGFLSGLLVTTPDMHISVDEYYDKYKMADIFIKATMGLTEDDLKEVKRVDNVKEIMPAYVIDTLMNVDNKSTIVAKVYGIPLLDSEEEANINKLELLEGRMPQNTRECVVERKGPFLSDVKIGSKLKISRENKDYEDIDDIFEEKEYKVVGIVGNSFHFSLEREISNVGSGKLGTIMYVDRESYALDTFTDFYILADKTENMDSFSTEYGDYIENIRKDIEKIGEKRSISRKREILSEANEKLKEGYEEYNEGKEKADRELEKGLREINKGKRDLQIALRDIKAGEKELKDAQILLEKENIKAKKDLEFGEKEREQAKLNLIKGENRLETVKLELDKGNLELSKADKELLIGERDILRGKENLKRGLIELKRVKEELERGQTQYEIGISDLEIGKAKFLSDISKITSSIPSFSPEELFSTVLGRTALKNALRENPDLYKELTQNWDDIKAGEMGLSQANKEIDEGRKQYNTGLQQLRLAEIELDDAEREIKKGKIEIESNRMKLQTGKREYEKGLREIERGWKEYEVGVIEIQEGKKTLEFETENALKEIENAEKNLKQGLLEYNKGIKEIEIAERNYNRAKSEIEEELKDAYDEIKDAENEIRDLDDPEWYVLDRESNISYVSFVLNADKVDAVAKVFPIFFYLVAGLVALTTMTRMVEEERTQIGVLKALGYKRTTIIFKYILYCGLASLLGSIAGLLVGFKLIPRVIWNAYGTMYHLPKFVTDYNNKIALLSSGMAILSTVAATYFSASGSLREKPALLMLPRPPKKGKRIILERITPLWSVMSFNLKSTARNIFRYKKHFYMTVIGISGCTALLVAGFGLRDSIKDIGDLQFDQLFKYELEIQLEDDFPQNKIKQITENQKEITGVLEVFSDTGYVQFNNERIETILVGVENIEDIDEYVLFRNRKKGKIIEPSKDKIIISEKAAEILKVKEGDTIIYENSDEIKKEFKIGGITENYVRNYLYMEKSIYERTFKVKKETNTIYVKTEELDSKMEDKLIKDLYQNDGVLNAEFISQSRGIFDNLIESINYIVLVIIVASGLLAFIVLYNLTNININERRRELATLKVLGFHNNEVSSYIFREITILTFIGTFVGLGLGRYLHQFIILTVEDSAFMFGRDARFISYVISAIITLFFSAVVDIFMAKKLRNIKMVDSLKAND